MASLRQRGCVHFFLPASYRRRGGGVVLNKGTLRGREAGFFEAGYRVTVVITKAMESKFKKQFQHGVGTDFSLQQCVTHR